MSFIPWRKVFRAGPFMFSRIFCHNVPHFVLLKRTVQLYCTAVTRSIAITRPLHRACWLLTGCGDTTDGVVVASCVAPLHVRHAVLPYTTVFGIGTTPSFWYFWCSTKRVPKFAILVCYSLGTPTEGGGAQACGARAARSAGSWQIFFTYLWTRPYNTAEEPGRKFDLSTAVFPVRTGYRYAVLFVYPWWLHVHDTRSHGHSTITVLLLLIVLPYGIL